MERKEKIQLIVIAVFIILIIIAVWGVFQRQLFQKKAGKTGRPVTVDIVAVKGTKPGEFQASIQMITNQALPVSGAEATVTISDKLTIDDINSKCIAPFDRIVRNEINTETNTATFLCAIDPNATPPTLEVGKGMQFARLFLTVKDNQSGEAPITFTRTRVTQANIENQAPDIANDGTNYTYQIASIQPSPTLPLSEAPDCSGGITVSDLQPVNGKYILQKGQTYQVQANGITDPGKDIAQSIENVGFRYKSISASADNQCASPDDKSFLGRGIETGSGVDIKYSYILHTDELPSGEFYIFANPIDDQGLLCSGNPYASSKNNYCGVNVGCTNCSTVIVITGTDVTPTIPPNCPLKSKGDANCDGKLDPIDYSILINSQCAKTSPNQVCADLRADFNGDGEVNQVDKDIIIRALISGG